MCSNKQKKTSLPQNLDRSGEDSLGTVFDKEDNSLRGSCLFRTSHRPTAVCLNPKPFAYRPLFSQLDGLFYFAAFKKGADVVLEQTVAQAWEDLWFRLPPPPMDATPLPSTKWGPKSTPPQGYATSPWIVPPPPHWHVTLPVVRRLRQRRTLAFGAKSLVFLLKTNTPLSYPLDKSCSWTLQARQFVTGQLTMQWLFVCG